MHKLSVIALSAFLLLAMSSTARAGSVTGRVVTCPAGDPIAGIPVTIWFNGEWVGQAVTGANGWYTGAAGPADCDPLSSVVTVTLGGSIHLPYYQNYCPAGRHGTGANCCVQVAKSTDCHGEIMQDLELRCGTPGDPPCPSQ